MDGTKFKPKTVYVTYIATTPEKVWQALTDPAFSKQYFFGFAVDLEPRAGGAFFLRYPDGRVHVRGEILDWSPPRRFACTWLVEGMKEFGELPECLVTYDIEQAGEAVRLTMTESHSWDVPDAILAGGRAGWPAILSSLKSVLETGKPLVVKMGPPAEMMEAVARAVAEKPWLKSLP
ncbi:MAG TPA: SRPBCC family protein [Pseudolabrys sp.]|nr:SRPBCC family protein [Pseudolabrys sp.]